MIDAAETTVRIAVDLLVREEFAALESLDKGDRLTAADYEAALLEYGKELAEPGDDWWNLVSITQVNGAGVTFPYTTGGNCRLQLGEPVNGASRPSALCIFPTSDGIRNQVIGETTM